jgi:integrase
MPRNRASMPAYRYHISGQARVTLDGKDFYLGEFDSPESKARYFALLAEYNENGKRAPEVDQHLSDAPITVQCVTAEFREHIKTKYASNPKEKNRFENLCSTLEYDYGDLPAEKFGPRKLAELRDLFVTGGNCRRYANRQTRNVIQIFRHAVSRELIGPNRIVALESLESLRYGQTKAPESTPVLPVDIEAVRLTARHLSPTQKAMVRVQAATGMRSGEVCIMRPCDIEKRDDGVWLYRPAKHKTTYRGKVKVVPIVGDAKMALKPFLDRADDAYCFSPRESAQWFRDQRTANRKTPHGPGRNAVGTNRKANPKRQPGEKFTPGTYYQSMKRAAEKANTDHWCPRQLRHTAASVIREALGLEHAQAMLGHSHAAMTEHYAKLTESKAIEAARAAPSVG